MDIIEYITTRYDNIENIEIFNEPNYMKPSYSTEEEIEYYSKIVKEVSDTAKKINPNIKIIAGSVACTNEEIDGKVPYKTFLNKITQYGAYKYSDAYSYHPYEFYKSNAQNLTYYKLLLDSGNELNNYGGFIGNYITEYGVSNYTGNGFTEDIQATRLVQQATINDRVGVDFSLIYVFRNPGANVDNAEHNFGLLNSNYTPKLSYYAMKNYYENTNGAEYVGTINISEGLETHVYNKDGKPKIITWSDNEKNKITIPYQKFKAKDLYGKDIEPDENGNITITTSPVYLNDVDYKYFYQAISNTTITKYEEFKKKFSNEIEKMPELTNQITRLEDNMSNIKNMSIEIGEKESIQLMQGHYELGDLIIQSYQEGKLDIEYVKLSSILDIIDDIGDSYEDLVTISAKTINESELEETNEKIQKAEAKINNNKDLEVIYPTKILDVSKELHKKSDYIKSLEEENDIKLGLIVSKNMHARFLANWAEKFAQLYIDQYVSDNPVEIKYSETELTNKNVTATIQTNAEIQIINNEGSKEHTFEENGRFTFEYTIKGQAFSKVAEVNNIDKQSPIIEGVEKGKQYNEKAQIKVTDENLLEVKLILNDEEIEYKPNMILTEEGFYEINAKDKAGNITTINFEIIVNQEEAYQIKENTIENITNNTKRADFEKNLKIEDKYEILRSDKILEKDSVIATGDILRTESGQEHTLIVVGDINKDGDVNIKDLIRMRKYLLGEKELDDSEKLAADCNLDGKKINIKDFIRMRIIALTKGIITYAEEVVETRGTIELNEATPKAEVEIKPLKSNDRKTIILTLSVGKFTNVKENATLGYETILNYEEDIFETVEAEDVKGLNAWTATYSPTTKAIIGDPIVGAENTDITEITLHLKDGIEAENTTISLTNFLLSDDGENDLYTSDLPIEISIKKEEPTTQPEVPDKSEETKTPDKNTTTISTDGTVAKANSLPKAGNTVLVIGIVAILVIIAFGVISGKGYIGYLKDTHKQIKK